MSELPALLQGGRFTLLFKLVLVGILQAATAIGSSLLAKFLFDRLLEDSRAIRPEWLAPCAGALAALALIQGLLGFAERVVAEQMGQSYAQAVRLALFDKLASLNPRTLQQRSRGGVLLRFVGDLAAVRQWVSLGLARLTIIGMTALGCLGALALINQPLALVVSAALIIGTLLSASRGKAMREAAREARRRVAKLAGNLGEKIGALAVVQANGQLRRERNRVLDQSRAIQRLMIERAKVAGDIRALAETFAAFAYTGALTLGAWQVAEGKMTAGAIVAALTVVSFLVPRLRECGRVQEYWHGFVVARQKMAEFMNMPSVVVESPLAQELSVIEGRLEFRNVSVAGALHDLSVSAEAGSIVAVVGPNGSGKSTLLALAARLLDPDSGQVLLDGQDLARCTFASIRKAIGVAGSDFPLLRGTVERNLRYRWAQAPSSECERVDALCGIPEVLDSLPQGLKTRVGEGGAGLSAGQRQRIALARALLGNPSLLLLDEVDANLDASASVVMDRILATRNGTVLMVTHRREHIARADAVWLLDKGRLIEVVTPVEILRNQGVTAKFFKPRLAG
jgi:ABC-type multidrug transport system fused ATPase/permease subunit